MKSDSFVSLVLLSPGGLGSIEGALRACHASLADHYSDYEIVVVSQGPNLPNAQSDSAVMEELPCLRMLQLSSAVDPDVAWGAGLENSIGDFVILFDHISDPVTVIDELVQTCRSGIDVVIGTAKRRPSVPYFFFRLFAGWVLRAADYELPKDATGLRCLSRRAVNAVTRTGRFHHQLYMRIQKTGYRSADFPYTLVGKLRPKSFLGGLRSLGHLVVFNSSRPLRWMSGLGILGSFLAMVFGLYSVVLHLLTENVVQGWTTTVLSVSTLFLIQFVMLAFFGEYLGRLLDERSGQSDYSVVSEQHSSIMVDSDRVNVMADSTIVDGSKVQTGRAQ